MNPCTLCGGAIAEALLRRDPNAIICLKCWLNGAPIPPPSPKAVTPPTPPASVGPEPIEHTFGTSPTQPSARQAQAVKKTSAERIEYLRNLSRPRNAR